MICVYCNGETYDGTDEHEECVEESCAKSVYAVYDEHEEMIASTSDYDEALVLAGDRGSIDPS